MKEYSVNTLKLLVNGECINLGCFVDLVKNKPINMEQHIASYKHLIGCEYICNGMIGFVEDSDVGHYWVDNQPNLKSENVKFYLDDETLGTYKEYMQLHYPEYIHVWNHQL